MKWINQHINYFTLASFILLVIGMLLRWTHFTAGDIFLMIATLIALIPIGLKAYQALVMKVFSIELLVTIAVIGALVIQEYTESSIVTFLFLFGQYLEVRTLNKTRSSIQSLMAMAPKTATVIRHGEEVEVDVEDVMVGDHIVIKAGDIVPVDGEVISGEAAMIEATLTGESQPIIKGINDKVYSGTVLDSGYLRVFAEQVGDDTTFSKIIELVEEAQDRKSPAERFLDKFSHYYTPIVVILAVIVGIIMQDLHLAITFLVVACPGALVIGAPVANVAGIGNGAQHGVLIKGGDVIDQFSKVKQIIFDKTGTLTKGTPEVTTFINYSDRDDQQLLNAIATLETASEHHLGRAIVQYAQPQQAVLEEVQTFKGKGITGRVDDVFYIAGNRRLMQDYHIDIQHVEEEVIRLEKQGHTVIYVASDSLIALIGISDQVREDARTAIERLKQLGIQTMMLTGDNMHTAGTVAQQLTIDAFQGDLLPADKLDYITEAQTRRRVAMVGDGVNDAPAIAQADVGIAMGRSGTEVSMETADVVLMGDELKQLVYALNLSKQTMKVLKQNIFIALFTVIMLLMGIIFGGVNLAIGMFIHEMSVLIVIVNAMRLLKFEV